MCQADKEFSIKKFGISLCHTYIAHIQIQNVTDMNVTKNNKHCDDDEQHNDMKQMENLFDKSVFHSPPFKHPSHDPL